MLNAYKLKGRIVEQRESIASVARATGIDRSTFYRKIKGECPFTIQEADSIVSYLNLSVSDAVSIFLAN